MIGVLYNIIKRSSLFIDRVNYRERFGQSVSGAISIIATLTPTLQKNGLDDEKRTKKKKK
jgi:hypothetical protein